MGSAPIWDELSPEERCVMVNAVEEAYLNGVIGDFLGHAQRGGAIWMFSNDEAAIRDLIPRFSTVVASLIRRDFVEIREPSNGVWDDAPALTQSEISDILTDLDSWLWTDGEAKRMVMLMTTDKFDRLIGR